MNDANDPAPDADEGSEPAITGATAGVPYTVYFPAKGGGFATADLAHPAPLPRIGDLVEYLDEAGITHAYRVRDVVHTLQASLDRRAKVHDTGSPASLPHAGEGPQRVPESGELRTGLPRVILVAADQEL